jgi:hypothetical protein
LTDPYSYYWDALALTQGKRAVTREEMLAMGVTESPQAGFFRRRLQRGGLFVPVAIWPNGNGMTALVEGREVSADEVWTYCVAHPVPEDWYRDKMEGRPWPDEDIQEGNLTHDTSTNAPPTDPLEAKRIEIENALGDAGKYAVITSDDMAAQAQARRSRLNELSNEADKAREKLVRPHLDAEKAVNGQWMPLVKAAKAGADTIRAALSTYETKKETARRDAERKRLAEEQARQEEARRAAAAAAEAGKPAPPPPEPAPTPVPQPTVIRGAAGRAATKKMKKLATVTDYDAAFGYLKGAQEIKDLLGRLAQKAVDAGQVVPGVTVEEVIDVR